MKNIFNITMFLSVCILYSLLVTTSCSEFHNKVFNNLLRLCPGQYVPAENVTGLNQTSEFNGCCTDTFSNYSLTNAALNKTKHTTHGQKCLFPSTDASPQLLQTQRSYLMITDPPNDGCLLPDADAKTMNGNSFNQPTCKDSEVTPFRRFLPVYSKSSGFIYKNPHCASCHGQYDVELWTTFAQCDISNALSYQPDDCDFQFAYPGNSDVINHLECFTDYFSACPVGTSEENANILTETQLTHNELRDACSMDNLPKFFHLKFAKNIFCYFCHYCRGHCTIGAESCSFPTMSRSTERGFSRILDSRVVSQFHAGEDTICGLDLDEQVCHDVLCPLGQLMTFDGVVKKCKMGSTRWTAHTFLAFLMLEFDQSIDVHKNNLQTILTQQNKIQLPKSWSVATLNQPFARIADMVRVSKLAYNVSSNATLVDSVNHAYLTVTYSHNNANPAKLQKDLETLSMSTWYFTIDGVRYRARQTLSRATLDAIEADHSLGETRNPIIPIWQHSPDVLPYDRWLYKVFLINRIRGKAYILKKPLLCKQIELASTNFRVITHRNDPIALFYNRSGQYLFDNEFAKGTRRDGEETFRVCVSDVMLKSNESARLLLSLKLLLLATVIVNVL